MAYSWPALITRECLSRLRCVPRSAVVVSRASDCNRHQDNASSPWAWSPPWGCPGVLRFAVCIWRATMPTSSCRLLGPFVWGCTLLGLRATRLVPPKKNTLSNYACACLADDTLPSSIRYDTIRYDTCHPAILLSQLPSYSHPSRRSFAPSLLRLAPARSDRGEAACREHTPHHHTRP